jgi:hypothetical protein
MVLETPGPFLVVVEHALTVFCEQDVPLRQDTSDARSTLDRARERLWSPLLQVISGPDGATHLFIGISDSTGGDSLPGAFGDNVGSFAVTGATYLPN